METFANKRIKLSSFLALIFFLSGFASLIYQVIWQRILTMHYGVGAISITIIVSVYMLGLGAGGLVGGLIVERFRYRFGLYFVIELLIGVFGIVSLPFLDYLGQKTAGTSYFWASLSIFSFLFVPTFLMGTTLPILTKIFNNLINDFFNTVSLLYFINTLGAAIGAIFASYFLISFFGLAFALNFAVVINLALAIFIFLAKLYPKKREAVYSITNQPYMQSFLSVKFAYLIVTITGFLAIGYEILWFRVVGVLVKASPYAFSTVLFSYLIGIAFGSLLMSKVLQRKKISDLKSFLFLLQFLIGVYIIFSFCSYYFATKYTRFDILTRHSFFHILHPYLAIPSFESIGDFFRDLFSLFDVFFWPMFFIFIPTVFMGACFPLISTLALTQKNREGWTVGTVYFFNILGNVFGGIITGFILMPFIGTEYTLFLFSSIGLILGLFVSDLFGKMLSIRKKAPIIIMMLLISLALFPKKGQLYQVMHFPPSDQFKTYIEEGIDSVILTYNKKDNYRNYINGLHHGGRPGYEYYNKVIEAVSFVPNIQKALIIGYGTGSFTEAVLKLNELEKVTVVELSKTLINNSYKFPYFRQVQADKRLELIVDDARRYLLRTDETYDLILMDPLRTTTSYSNNLYSDYFFYLLSKHLSNSGAILIFTDEMHVLPKTVLSVFSNVRLYRHRTNSFTIASNSLLIADIDRKNNYVKSFSSQDQVNLSQSEYKPILIGDQDYIRTETKGFPINRDLNPICEYYIGLQIKKKLIFSERSKGLISYP